MRALAEAAAACTVSLDPQIPKMSCGAFAAQGVLYGGMKGTRNGYKGSSEITSNSHEVTAACSSIWRDIISLRSARTSYLSFVRPL